MSGKTCLVTGATTGIGKETAVALAGLGAALIIVARDPARGENAASEIRQRVPGAQVGILTADLSSLAQVRRLAEEVASRYDRLDVLVNNAGVIMTRRQLTVDGLETTFATNHLAPFLLTNLLRGVLKQGARVVTVSSGAHKSARPERGADPCLSFKSLACKTIGPSRTGGWCTTRSSGSTH